MKIYWPVFAAIGLHIANFATSLPLGEAGTIRRFLLASLPTSSVFLWGIITSGSARWSLQAMQQPNSPWLAGFTTRATLCLFCVLLLLIPRNLVARRIRMPTAFSLGACATIAAVYADLLFIFICITPWEG